MDKTAIKNYAVTARRNLLDAVRREMSLIYIYAEGAEPLEVVIPKLQEDGIFLTNKQIEARKRLCAYLEYCSNDMSGEEAFHHVLEEVAYTWFNRLIALRYMEVNDYLPSGIRILSSVEADRAEPDAMREAERLPYVDQDKISEYRVDTSHGAEERLYRYILISQCNALHDILPGMFQEINDYTELLLPKSLYQRGGIVYDLVHGIAEADFREQVQIIGWLYQYYISEKKDEVFAALKKNVKINKETIPAATQLFTPEWIVKYMVENSLGRLWLEHLQGQQADSVPMNFSMDFSNNDDKINDLKSKWKYYVEEAEQEPEVAKQLEELRKQNPISRPEDIKLIDPCMGSGHILVYAFDVLHQIYLSEGYSEREIPELILQNNIFGLDIDGRAAQLSYFALMMKARGYSRRFFRQSTILQPHVNAVIESRGVETHHLDYMGDGMSEAEREECQNGLIYLIDLFRDAREYGSILKIEQELDYDKLRQFVKSVKTGQIDMFAGDIDYAVKILLEIIEVAESLSRKYDVVVTNPPYMSANGMGALLSKYVKQYYFDSKADIFAVFIDMCISRTNSAGYLSLVTMQSWMFLSSFANMRKRVLSNVICSLAQIGYNSFPEMNSKVAQAVAFTLKHSQISNYEGAYLDLTSRYPQTFDKAEAFRIEKLENIIYTKQDRYSVIPGRPIAYWVNNNVINAFKKAIKIGEFCRVSEGIKTGDNERFLRYWPEVDFLQFSCRKSRDGYKWYPHHKGGEYRRWYGNLEWVIMWERDGETIKKARNSGLQGQDMYFEEMCGSTKVSSKDTTIRYYPSNILFDSGAPSFTTKVHLKYVMAVINSKVGGYILRILNPTIGLQVGDLKSIPIIFYRNDYIEDITNQCIKIACIDWDSFETSWDFKTHPLITFKGNYEEAELLMVAEDLEEGVVVTEWSKTTAPIAQAFDAWERFCDEQFYKLKSNEEELNRIFIDIYGLQDELTPEVEDKDVTIRKADLGRDIRSFISYAVGCMFGRYSLYEDSLFYAGGPWDYDSKVEQISEAAKAKGMELWLPGDLFLPDRDNIIPIGSADYFEDDIVVRFCEFVSKVYGAETQDENLHFIAEALYPGGNGSDKDKIRRYFLNDFYKDHLKIYQKRPIYWMMDSSGGKRGKGGFKALFYIHRYDRYTIARARTDYLHPLQRKYEAEINRLEMLLGTTDNAREKVAYRKEIENLQAKIDECRSYDQIVSHIAHQQMELDLDDGVKVNYAKFQGVEVPVGDGKTEPMNLFAKI